ncbi:hypothetical protein N7495_009379 [Penicillium taxi]|uniref:uncharacterized protein n=1 Tax=Penicillium taxi TaxID=168475 RepID=UPI002545015B|nr:uncharacterized protein N7495_009379 [Penicillium taxi]KAJ5884869.1 hypothetical protein N7495_009379 [Penicillium taxi]
MLIDDSPSKSELFDNFSFLANVAQPTFLIMHMAQDGTLFSEDYLPVLIIDDRTFATGLALWAGFENNSVADQINFAFFRGSN